MLVFTVCKEHENINHFVLQLKDHLIQMFLQVVDQSPQPLQFEQNLDILRAYELQVAECQED